MKKMVSLACKSFHGTYWLIYFHFSLFLLCLFSGPILTVVSNNFQLEMMAVFVSGKLLDGFFLSLESQLAWK